MATIQGLDLSYCQPTVNFQTVKAQGYKFVILRGGYGNALLYPNQYDPVFESHYKNAKAQGLDVGVYWYSYAQSVDAARQEAQACIKIMQGKKFEYPIYFDIEEKSQFDKGMAFCDSIITAFCSELEKAGYYPGLYCSTFWLTNYVSASVRSKYPVWIAEYNTQCTYRGSYGMWQNGLVFLSGTGNVDHDYCYVDYPSIIKKAGKNGYTATPTPAPAPTIYKTYYANDKSGVNYRKTPNGVLMGTYKYAEAVSVAVGSETVKDGLTWVQAKNGYWSAKNLLSTTKPSVDTYKTYYANDPTGVNYRQTPNGKLMGVYKYGEAVSVLVGSDTLNSGLTWVKAKNGYWSAKNLLTTTKPVTASAPYQKGKTYTLQTDMKVRSGGTAGAPQLKYSALTTADKKNAYKQTWAVLKKGTKITLRGVVKLSDKEYWGKIASGYVCLKTASKTYVK